MHASTGIPIDQSVYVGCALTHAPQQFKDDIVAFKAGIRRYIHVLEFVGPTAGTPKDVYKTDIRYAEEALLFVAVCDIPSIGLGMEIQARFHAKRPLLLLARDFSQVTRIVSGGAEVHAGITVTGTYKDLPTEGPRIVQEVLSIL